VTLIEIEQVPLAAIVPPLRLSEVAFAAPVIVAPPPQPLEVRLVVLAFFTAPAAG